MKKEKEPNPWIDVTLIGIAIVIVLEIVTHVGENQVFYEEFLRKLLGQK